MDDRGFDNIARRLGGLQSRRSALKTAGCGAAAAVFAAFGLEHSALAQVTIQDHCVPRGGSCVRKTDCCGQRRRSNEIVCKASTAGTGLRCCGQQTARCNDTTDCCELYRCNSNLKCVLI